MPEFNFCGGSYKGRSIAIDTQECVNFYPEPAQSSDSKSPISLIGTPGLKYKAKIGATLTNAAGTAGTNRGMFVSAGERAFAVIGIKFIEIQTNLSSIERGTLVTNLGRCSFAEVIHPSGSYIMVVDGHTGYIFDTSLNTFTPITDPGYVPGTSVVSMNGYFIQNTLQSYYSGSRFIFSGQFADANTWDPLDYFTAEVSPDPILSLQTINSELWLMGSKTTEIWSYTGDINQLFARITTGFINQGAGAPYAVTTFGNDIYWLGSSLQGSQTIWQASGYIPKQVSTNAIEFILGSINTSDCVAFSYQQEGHSFIVFNFVSGNRTLVFDASTGAWHERCSYDVSTGKNNHHRAISPISWQGKIYVGDVSTNKIYEWDLNTFFDDGVMIVRQRIAGHIHTDRKRMFFREFEIDLERGVGLLPQIGTAPGVNFEGPTSITGQDPQVMLQTSRDGGFTWSHERWSTAGPRGARLQRVHWHKMGGNTRDMVFRATFTDPVKWIIVGARLDVDVAEQ